MARKTRKQTSEEVALMLKQGKSNSRILMNTMLLLVAFAVFAILIAMDPNLLTSNQLLTMQLVMSVPFLLTSTLANSKLTYTHHEHHWDNLGWATFIVGYGFLLNVIGLLVYSIIGFLPAMAFFAVNIFLTLLYSSVHISYSRDVLFRRIMKDSYFIAILVFFGIGPVLL